MKFLATLQLSERLSLTAEGFLVCADVAITRTGELLYLPSDLILESGEDSPFVPGPDGIIRLQRTDEDIFNDATIASFQGKPVTLNHPTDDDDNNVDVTPDNYRDVASGTVQNVRRGTGEDADKLIADFMLTEATAIHAVTQLGIREVSCGYSFKPVATEPGYGRQTNIRGNHVAIVQRGRAGAECAIFDNQTVESVMPLKEKIKAALSSLLTVVDSEPDSVTAASAEDKTAAAVAKLNAADAADLSQLVLDFQSSLAYARDEMTRCADRIAVLEEAIKRLSADDTSAVIVDDKAAVVTDEKSKEVATDTDTLSAAEILAPGISLDGNVKVNALRAAYARDDGKAVINRLTGGVEPDYTNDSAVSMLFIAASAVLGARREVVQNIATTAHDGATMSASNPPTPEAINAMNAKRYAAT